MTYYRSTVVEIGEEAGEMAEAGVLILFGEPLPEALAEVSIVHRPTQTLQGHAISVGDTVALIAEVMGRHVGWIALHSGMAAGAHAILIPEQKTSIEQICEWAESARDRGRAPLICVAEGFKLDTMDDAHSERGLDAFGRPRLGGISDQLAPEIEKRTGIETRATTLGHIQRGGTPTAYDRVLATRYGMAAIESIRSGHWGRMVALRGTQIVHVPFEDALGRLKVVPQNRYEEAAVLFG